MIKCATGRWLCLLTAIGLAGLPAAKAQSEGLAPAWDVRSSMTALADQAQRLKPVLEKIQPQDWVAKGAPEAYVAQWNSVRAELEFLVGASKELATDPERLTVALETYFRLESLESKLHSLAAGVRTYQNPALADLMQDIAGENSPHRGILRQYVVDLASLKEQEFKVADREAQRCRDSLSRKPATLQRAEQQ